jgi:hypothetical protein
MSVHPQSRRLKPHSTHLKAVALAQNRVFGIENGPSGGPELLAALYLDDPFWGFWYGHVLPHPQKPHVYVALLVWTEKFINADRVPLLFRRFHYWIKDRLEYQPCTAQSDGDAYAETNSLDAAASALIRMIKEFDFDKRSGLEGSVFESDPTDNRILGIYGMLGAMDDRGCYPPLPMPTELRLVRNLE